MRSVRLMRNDVDTFKQRVAGLTTTFQGYVFAQIAGAAYSRSRAWRPRDSRLLTVPTSQPMAAAAWS